MHLVRGFLSNLTGTGMCLLLAELKWKGKVAQTGGGSTSLPVFSAVREIRSDQFLGEVMCLCGYVMAALC